MVERQKASFQLFIAYKQFAKPVEPTVCHFDDPAPRLLLGVFAFVARLPFAAFDMRNVPMRLDDPQRRRTRVSGVSAQMFTAPLGWNRALDHTSGEHRLNLADVMPMGPGHDDR